MKVLIGGDFCPRFRGVNIIENNSYEDYFSEIRSVIRLANYSIVNLECPITNGKATPITKQGPNLMCSEKVLDAISYMGFRCVTLANNHFYDYGDEGAIFTLQALETRNIDHVGGGANLKEAGAILYKEINGCRLAIINCCEHEFSIATDKTGGSNPLNPIKQYAAIQEAQRFADYVIVIIHGGHEHYQLPSPRMVETYHFFVDAGADAVINHHQHCYSGYEVYKGKPVFYGLGNLYFDIEPTRINQPWNYGYMVMMDFNNSDITFTIHPYCQCGETLNIKLLDSHSFDTDIERLNQIIQNSVLLQEEIEKYYEKSMSEVEYFLNPYQNRLVRGLSKVGIIPSLLKKKWLLKLQNYLLCEAHRDKVEYYLMHKNNN